MGEFFFYIDETGRDPFSPVFISGILSTSTIRQELEYTLMGLEKTSAQGKAPRWKWSKSNSKYRKAYIEGVLKIQALVGNVFFHLVRGGKEYLDHTADGAVNAVREKAKRGDKATMYFDGFRETEVNQIRRYIRPSLKSKGIRAIVKGIARDESSPFIRLADAICGLVRDAEEDDEWSKLMVQKLKRKKILKEV